MPLGVQNKDNIFTHSFASLTLSMKILSLFFTPRGTLLHFSSLITSIIVIIFTETTKSAREVARQQRRRNYSQQGTTSNNKKDGDQMKTV